MDREKGTIWGIGSPENHQTEGGHVGRVWISEGLLEQTPDTKRSIGDALVKYRRGHGKGSGVALRGKICFRLYNIK